VQQQKNRPTMNQVSKLEIYVKFTPTAEGRLLSKAANKQL
jgi:hypothetical protein